MKLKNIFYSILSVAFLATSFASCSDDDDPVYSDKNEIISFKVGERNGVINQTTKKIEILLDKTTPLDQVTPTIVASEFAEVTPKSGEVVDLSTVLTYMVKAQNGEIAKYEVSASHIKDSDAKVTGFKFKEFPESEVAINEEAKTIIVTLPKGTALTALTPIVDFVGKEIDLEKDKAMDFTQAQTFTVTAEDGTTKASYTVTVVTGKSEVAKITDFLFKDVDTKGVIDEDKKTIAIEVPFGTDVTKLIPVIVVAEGAKTNLKEGEAMDFTQPQDVVVTAEDEKTTATYKVTVTAAEKTVAEKLLNSWNLEDYTASGKISNADVQKAVLDEINSGITNIEIPLGENIIPIELPIKKLLKGVDLAFGKDGVFSAELSTYALTEEEDSKPVVAKGKYSVENDDVTIAKFTNLDFGAIGELIAQMGMELDPAAVVELVNGILPFSLKITEIKEGDSFVAEVDIAKFYGTDKIAGIIKSAKIEGVDAKDVKVESLTVKVTCKVPAEKK